MDNEYIDVLARRALAGDEEAKAELRMWGKKDEEERIAELKSDPEVWDAFMEIWNGLEDTLGDTSLTMTERASMVMMNSSFLVGVLSGHPQSMILRQALQGAQMKEMDRIANQILGFDLRKMLRPNRG